MEEIPSPYLGVYMLYGFLSEDLAQISENDPLYIQAQYARENGNYTEIDIGNKRILNCVGVETSIKAEQLMLRSTCDYLEDALDFLEAHKIHLLENREEIEKIEDWYRCGLTQRQIYEISFDEVVNGTIKGDIYRAISGMNRIFIKSKRKGFSCTVSSYQFLSGNNQLYNFLRENCSLWGKTLLISECLSIKIDSLGKKEFRCFVRDGRIMNISRQLLSLVYCVPKSKLKAAEEIVSRINSIRDFPQNYVLDIGEFMQNQESYLDIVELNPITTATCYIGNSIFGGISSEDTPSKLGIGIEFYEDYLKHPNKYRLEKSSNMKYAISSDSHVDFHF